MVLVCNDFEENCVVWWSGFVLFVEVMVLGKELDWGGMVFPV